MAFGITQAKSIFTSKTFWGSVIALVSVISPSFYQHVLSSVGVSDPTVLTAKIVGGIGVALAIYGRFAAVQPVTLTGGPVAVTVDTRQKVSEIPASGQVVQSGSLVTTTKFVPDGHPLPDAEVKPVKWTDMSGEIPKK